MSRAMRLRHRRSFLCQAQRYAQKKAEGKCLVHYPLCM